MKKILFIIAAMAALTFTSCSKEDEPKPEPSLDIYTDRGVVINGVRWATRNVDAPGTFTPAIQSYGQYYQWGKNTGDWDETAVTDSLWAAAGDPSPEGWRVPTRQEIESLLDQEHVINRWTVVSAVAGREFTDRATGATVFFPAAGLVQDASGAVRSKGAYGYYWSNVMMADSEYNDDENYAWFLFVSDNTSYSAVSDGTNKVSGQVIRPVEDN